MDYDVTITLAEHGRDADAGDLLLDALVTAAPDVGPVAEQSLRSGALSATITVGAGSADEALKRGRGIFETAIGRSGLKSPRVVSLHVDAVGAPELQPA